MAIFIAAVVLIAGFTLAAPKLHHTQCMQPDALSNETAQNIR